MQVIRHIQFRLQRYLLCSMVCLIFLSAQAQKSAKLVGKADNLYMQEKYEQALKGYQKIAVADPEYSYALLQSARCYEALEQYAAADRGYEQLFYAAESVDPLVFMEYGSLLMKVGKADRARSYFSSYNNLVEKNDLRALSYIDAIENYDKYFFDSAFVDVRASSFSTVGSDRLLALNGNRLYFSSNEKTLKSEPRNRQLMSAKPGEGVRKLTGQLLAYSGMSLAGATDELFLVHQEKQGSRVLRSFIEDDGKALSKPDEISITDFGSRIQEIAANSTGSMLVFSAQTSGGVGGKDLYQCFRNSYGYGAPVLLPGFANSLGDEGNPYILNDSILFFSSNGHGGVGGMDLYYINLNDPASLPRNVGYPINSRYDETELVVNESGMGYLVSNRMAGGTYEDIFQFQVVQQRAWGEVVDQQGGNNLKNVGIDITPDGAEVSSFALADNGHFSIVGAPGESFKLNIWKEGYVLEEFYINTAASPLAGLFEVQMGKFKLEILDDPAQQLQPEPAYFTQVAIPQPKSVVVPEALEKSLPVVESEPAMLAEELTPIVEEVSPKPVQIDVEPVVVEVVQPETPVATGKTVFRLQIAASRVPLNDAQLRAIYRGKRDIFMFSEENWHKYAIGEFDSYYAANQERRNCGVKGAFIAAYRNDTKLSLRLAIEDVVQQTVLPVHAALSNYQVVDRLEIGFGYDGIALRATEQAKLDGLWERLKTDSELQVYIAGHTDKLGTELYNLGLAQERGLLVKDYLQRKGLAASRIQVQSKGESELKKMCTANCTPAIHRENRRVEIVLYK